MCAVTEHASTAAAEQTCGRAQGVTFRVIHSGGVDQTPEWEIALDKGKLDEDET